MTLGHLSIHEYWLHDVVGTVLHHPDSLWRTKRLTLPAADSTDSC